MNYTFVVVLLAIAQNAQQIDKEVDEVEIERQGTEKGQLLHGLASVRSLQAHLLDFLRVPGGEAYEDEHTGIADNHVQA